MPPKPKLAKTGPVVNRDDWAVAALLASTVAVIGVCTVWFILTLNRLITTP